MSPEERLGSSLDSLGLAIPSEVQAKLLKYLDLLIRENEKINLTAIKGIEDGITKHLVDSLSGLLVLTALGSFDSLKLDIMDLGSGGGMPGLALALALPCSRVVLVESTKKKAHFLNLACAELGLMNRVTIEAERAETLGRGAYREKADLVTCRALGLLPEVLELSIPLLKPGSRALIFKGPKAKEELEKSGNAMRLLGAKLLGENSFKLPHSEEQRVLLLFEKTKPTPKQFPRLPGTPGKEPL